MCVFVILKSLPKSLYICFISRSPFLFFFLFLFSSSSFFSIFFFSIFFFSVFSYSFVFFLFFLFFSSSFVFLLLLLLRRLCLCLCLLLLRLLLLRLLLLRLLLLRLLLLRLLLLRLLLLRLLLLLLLLIKLFQSPNLRTLHNPIPFGSLKAHSISELSFLDVRGSSIQTSLLCDVWLYYLQISSFRLSFIHKPHPMIFPFDRKAILIFVEFATWCCPIV